MQQLDSHGFIIMSPHTQYYMFSQMIYARRIIADYETRGQNVEGLLSRWMVNISNILSNYGYINDTASFIIERIDHLL